MWSWIQQYPFETAAIVLYIVANVVPRPDASVMVGWRRSFWMTLDRLCLLTAGRVPGQLKGLFEASPPRREP
ncbi:MAG: hypothetical protein WC700_10350 [Gemmatimonadaceae bacterium]|jgi:hypothetical protein